MIGIHSFLQQMLRNAARMELWFTSPILYRVYDKRRTFPTHQKCLERSAEQATCEASQGAYIFLYNVVCKETQANQSIASNAGDRRYPP